MAEYTVREVTTTRVEFVLPNPTNWAELSKAIFGISQALHESKREADNTVTITATEEEMVLSYEKARDVRHV